jgi:hypothetical protein
MNNFKYSELNVEIPVMHMGMAVLMHVICGVRHLVKVGVLLNINVYIMLSALILAMCFKKHPVKSAI